MPTSRFLRQAALIDQKKKKELTYQRMDHHLSSPFVTSNCQTTLQGGHHNTAKKNKKNYPQHSHAPRNKSSLFKPNILHPQRDKQTEVIKKKENKFIKNNVAGASSGPVE